MPILGASADDRAADTWFRPETGTAFLRQALEDEHVSDRWIYQDLEAARRAAKESGKPILAVFRCVPCGSAPGLDGAICTAGGAEASRFEAEIRAAGGEVDAILDQFVAVRVVQMNGVNRNVFDFDRDVPHVAVFLNADGTVYGRYGTRTSKERKNLPRHNLASFQASLGRALALHREYPRTRTELANKRAEPRTPPMTEDMPTFEPFPANPANVKNCIHCHTTGEAEVRETIAAKSLALRDVWPFPLPQNIGVEIEVKDGLFVKSVRAGSAADAAGVAAGDAFVRLGGEPLTSEADIQWVLHHAPDEGTLPAVLHRGEELVETTIQLSGEWRRNDGHWRASLEPLRPSLILRTDPYKVQKGAAAGQMGLEVAYPRGPAAHAGLRNGDLVVGVDGRTDMHLEADFLKYIHFDRPEARSVELTVIRKGSMLKLTLPVR